MKAFELDPEGSRHYEGPTDDYLVLDEGTGKYICSICGYVYDPAKGDPDSGIQPGTPFESIPDDWECPVCGVGKEEFSAVEE